MRATPLIQEFKRLCHGSKQSVQSGQSLDDFDRYLHVDRPIDRTVRKAMDDIIKQGGGIVFLVGSAGDGKSHMIATLKSEYNNYFEFHNDASESPWTTIESLEALKIFIRNYKDETLYTTSDKTVVAINLGKLNALIDDTSVEEEYREIVECAGSLFDDNNHKSKETERVKIVSFSNNQLFEIDPSSYSDYPVDSVFLKTILSKITAKDCSNPFYKAFQKSTPVGNEVDPTYLNYQLLCLPEIQDSIVKTIIEAIVRFKLIISPREFFDFIYRIVVPDCYKSYNPSSDFFKTLLPNLFFCGGDNKIQKCLVQLDPIKNGSIEHNDMLSELFASNSIPDEPCYMKISKGIHNSFTVTLNEFYKNNRNNVEDISKLLFRINHLMKYHSESEEYKAFLSILCGYYSNDEERLYPIYETIEKSIPHYYGSYTDQVHVIPLDIQGRNYKLFVSCDNMKPLPDLNVPFDNDNRNQFIIEVETKWIINTEIKLVVEYQLFEYLSRINNGKLAQMSDRNHNLAFNHFISELVGQSDFKDRICILTPDNHHLTLSRVFGNKVTLK